MQKIVIDQPYCFVPPYPGKFWMHVFSYYLAYHLRRHWGVHTVEYRGAEHLRESLAAGHGIVLAPNHCRPFDPMVLGMLGIHVNQPFFILASWHLFKQSRFQAWLIRRLGTFSIYREGMDRESLKTAATILATGLRPLVILPEGVVTRTNDRLSTLQEGVAFIARSAAKLRARAESLGKVVVHPVALRYFFEGDLEASVTPVLTEIEQRLTWQPQAELPLIDRICKVGEGLLSLKEIEYLGRAQSGSLAERIRCLIETLLAPLEKEWLGGHRDPSVVERIKRLRSAIVPGLIGNEISEHERARRWRQLADAYLAQQLWFYPPGYLINNPTRERMLETVERFEEDITDVARIHRPLRVVMQVGPALEVSPARERGEEGDPLMRKIEQSLQDMLKELLQTGQRVYTSATRPQSVAL